MSHFSVLVITNGKPTEEDLAKVLQPWHEFECSGESDQYVVDVDKTTEALKIYNKDTTNKLHKSGQWAEDYYGTKQVTDPGKIDRDDTHKYGWALVDQDGNLKQLIDRTNPERKWDWWSIGGRWTGSLTPDYDPDQDPLNTETCWLCYGTGKRPDMESGSGCNGCLGTGIMKKWPTQWAKHKGDQLSAKQLRANLEALRAQSVIEALERRRTMLAAAGNHPIPVWSDEWHKEEDRKAFRDAPAVKAIRKDHPFATATEIQALKDPEEATIRRASESAAVTFALVHKGKWYERGRMGWWGAVSGEEDKDTWNTKVGELIARLDDNEWVTVVDCHI